jgi:predicted ribosomally synthesized peptide with SipW-like signal peptide
MKTPHTLSRRKILSGSAMVSTAGLLVAGTTAQFQDIETGEASFAAGNWARAVFSRENPSLDLLDVNGKITTVSTSNSAEVIGPTETKFSNLSGPYYAPYVYQEADLRLIDFVNGNKIILDTPTGTSYSPYTGRSVLTTGQWITSDGTDTDVSVFYIAKNGTSINRVVPRSPTSGNTVNISTSDVSEVASISNGVASLLGVADLNGDGERELYVVAASGEIKFLPLGGSSLQSTSSDALGTMNAAGAPRPTHINSYGIGIPYIYQGEIKLLYHDGGYQTTAAFSYSEVTSENKPAEAPVRICDYDGDGKGEILYVTKGTDNELHYADIPSDSSQSATSGSSTNSGVTTANMKTGVL